ncbi:hypothetical protein [Spirosoma montaniterrae]|uniref:DUF3575 domain-containing protein n=1 Tax=Spirosoma montaniterrae TaxID=1178516 RepID=A0A1P9WVM6_9BACT|nr:hypothetical protein [Spirosoma montaniterrae]AQG79429.1 hypothetical protein AWR27_08905 [Spirosoma montaniterrae]
MKNFFFSLLLLTVTSAFAQDSTIALRYQPRAVFKLAPLAFLEQDATLQAGLEYRTGIRTSVQGEFGYGWKGLSPFETDLDDFVSAEIWRGRAEVRFYSGRYRTNRRKGIAIRSSYPLGNYWAVEGLYKQINVVKQDNLYSREASSQSSFPGVIIGTQQRAISRYVFGSHLKIGRQFSSYEPQRRVFTRTLLDIYFGAGVRWAMNDVPPPPNPFPTCGCGFGRSFEQTGTAIMPSLTAGLKFGFAL